MELDSNTAVALRATLSVAVPLWIEKLRDRPWHYIAGRAAHCGQMVAEKGDVLQFGSKKKGATAEAFNALAEGLACLSFAAGGVKFMGMHFETKHDAPEETKKETPIRRARSIDDVKIVPRKARPL